VAPLDQASEDRLSLIYSRLATAARNGLERLEREKQLSLRIAQGLRTLPEQLEIYSHGRVEMEPGKWVVVVPEAVVSWAQPLKSWHLYGLAFDLAFNGPDPYLAKWSKDARDAAWKTVCEYFEVMGLTSGARFLHPDRPHVQYTAGLSIDGAKTLYDAGGLPRVWQEVDRLLLDKRRVVS
jgi:hypothetical protein